MIFIVIMQKFAKNHLPLAIAFIGTLVAAYSAFFEPDSFRNPFGRVLTLAIILVFIWPLYFAARKDREPAAILYVLVAGLIYVVWSTYGR